MTPPAEMIRVRLSCGHRGDAPANLSSAAETLRRHASEPLPYTAKAQPPEAEATS